MTNLASAGALESLFAGDGEMRALMRSRDWAQTPLGPVETWSQSLRTALSICLNSRFPMVIWWGKELVLLYNDAWRPILGTKHPKALGRPGQEVWSEIWDIIGVQLNSVLATGQATWSDDFLLPVDRYGYTEEAYFTYSYSPILLETGEVSGAFTAVTETTRRVIGERRLGSLRELSANAVGVKTVEEACRIASETLAKNPYDIPFALLYLVEDNDQQVRLVGTAGIEAETFVSASGNGIASPQQLDLTADTEGWNLAGVKTTGQAQLIDDLNTRFSSLPKGAWEDAPHSALVMPLAQSGKQQLAGLLVVGISPRREFDDDYRGFFDLVASNVATAIANARAYEAERKRAEALAEIDRAKTAFFSNVSHEFRTPLTLMLGPIEDALADAEAPLPPGQRERIEVLQRNSLRLLKLVNTLLDFSRLEAGRVQAVYEPTDLATFTAELASVFRSLIERAGMRLVVDCPPLPAAIYVDREMWEKIVLNLLSNAFKFTLAGTITVRLQDLGNRVELVVEDTGIGIPPDEIPHLFERFHRVKGAQGRSFEGSGIGLSLMQELVKLHGGSVNVTSVLGQGSCFTVSIPTDSAHLPSDRIGAPRTLASTAMGVNSYVEEAWRWLPEEEDGGTRRGGDKGSVAGEFPLSPSPLIPTKWGPRVPLVPLSSTARILLVDDNADMRDYVKRLLSQRYEVEAVEDGVAAIASIRHRLPDLVLTDVMMPRLDGFGLLQELRADPQTRELPIILLSARAGEESRIEGLEAGADDYLIKPFSARELLARIEAMLKMAQLRREAALQEQALRTEVQAAKDNLEDVLSRIGDQFLALDREWRYSYVNQRVVDITGKSQEELLGKCIWDVFPKLIGSQFHTELQRAVLEQTPVHFEYFYPTWNRWFENRVYPASDGVALFAAEITDRKQAELEIRKFVSLADNSTEFIGMCDMNFVPFYVNEAGRQMVGLDDARQYSETPVREFFFPEDQDFIVNEFFPRVLRSGRAEVEIRFRHFKTGEALWMIYNVFYIRGENDQPIGLATVSPNITDRKRAEIERDRILQLEQAARAEAERANRIKDEFLAVLSHELRSPLNPILGWSKLLQSRRLDEAKMKEALATIERNAKLQSQLIEDLLDVSRILRGKLTLNAAPVKLATVIAGAIDTVCLAAEANSIQIERQLDPSVGQVMGDSARLQQVVWNLLSNAVKFTPASGQVTVRLEQVGTDAQIQVTDTGKGISPDFLPHVFEYFRQADSTTTRKFGGLGLGLAIVKQLVELHGGIVQADSAGEGQGATFTVRLPLLQGSRELSDHSCTGAQPCAPTTPHFPLAGLRVLVVDDEADSREFVAFVLEQDGAQVVTASSATEALALLAQSKPDVMVSDIGMPEMDGYMLMRTVKTLSPGQSGPLPAIALTAYAGEFDRQQAQQAGFQIHLSKPVEPAQLVAVVAKLAGKEQ